MPRDGTETYILPFPDVVADTTIESPVYNGFTNDVAQDLNLPRPIVAGGTGATSAAGALAALGGETATQLVTNYDSYVFKAGSFYSAAGATAAPTANAFSGICYLSDANNIVIEARDGTTGILYVRRKVAGVWGAFAIDGSGNFVELSGDTMTGALVLPAAAPTLGTHATNKTYVDAGDTAAIAAADASIAAKAVRYDAAQSLNTTQKRQAASNQFQGVTMQYLTTTGTYTTPAGVLWIEIELVGGGSGGAGSGTSPGNGGSGGATTWGTGPILSSGIASGAVASSGAAGAVPSGGGVNKTGAAGGNASGLTNSKGGAGGASPFGGAGAAGSAGGGAGGPATANSGSGGGGAGASTAINGGGGGSSGGYVRHIINNPLASYGYVIGPGGTAGTLGTSGAAGGAGGSGGIIVTEHYNG